MNSSTYIFNRKILNKELQSYDLNVLSDLDKKLKITKNWAYSLQHSDLNKTKEEALQGDFLNNFFVDILGYKNRYGEKVWNISQEQKTKVDSTKSDGALGFFTSTFEDIRVVIELKDAKTNLDSKQNRTHRLSPVEQAFSYASKSGKNCKWVIVSNFKEIRLYSAESQGEYETFNVIDLGEVEEFKRFYFLLSKENLINRDEPSLIDKLYVKNENEQEKISKSFYKDYKSTRLQLFEHIKQNNPLIDELLILEKTQKIMDRFIFVCFCEDTKLLPEKVFRQVVSVALQSFDISETRIWEQLKGLFSSIDKGNSNLNINKFNGGLFKMDEILDNLIIKDSIFNDLLNISEYDFESELNVNILGHIFEQSISDIEEVRANIINKEFNLKQGKRKKDGIFYTPEYITNYIVDEAIGCWLKRHREDLGESSLPEIVEETKKMSPSEKGIRTKAIARHLEFWEAYRDILSNIKVLDPACGSGAFLNQAFDYLYKEGQLVNKTIADLKGGQITLFDLDKHILQNNLYGVDLNKESIEITKLALWIKTANKGSELTTLDDNIKCGDSLVDFNWGYEFPSVFNSGGFDIVIGNPPYVRHEAITTLKEKLSKKFEIYHGMADLYTYFIEQGFNLLKKDGYLAMIFPNKFMRAGYGKNLRQYLVRKNLISLIDFSDTPIFEDAVTYPLILLAQNTASTPKTTVDCIELRTNSIYEISKGLHSFLAENSIPLSINKFSQETWSFGSEVSNKLMSKIIKKSLPLKDSIHEKIYGGIKTGFNTAFVINEHTKSKLIKEDSTAKNIIVPFKAGKDIGRYNLKKSENYLILAYKGIDITQFKSILNYMEPYKEALANRSDIKGKGEWFELRACAYYDLYEKDKIIFPDISPNSRFHLDTSGSYLDMTAFFIPSNSKYLLALLNSKISFYCLKNISSSIRGGYFRFKRQYVEQLPVPKNVPKKIQIEIGNLTDTLTDSLTLKESIIKDFLNYLCQMHQLKKITVKLSSFYTLAFEHFHKELVKQKIHLSEMSKFELMQLFESQKQKVLSIIETYKVHEDVLNTKIYDLYNLTDDEKAIIDEAIAFGYPIE